MASESFCFGSLRIQGARGAFYGHPSPWPSPFGKGEGTWDGAFACTVRGAEGNVGRSFPMQRENGTCKHDPLSFRKGDGTWNAPLGMQREKWTAVNTSLSPSEGRGQVRGLRLASESFLFSDLSGFKGAKGAFYGYPSPWPSPFGKGEGTWDGAFPCSARGERKGTWDGLFHAA